MKPIWSNGALRRITKAAVAVLMLTAVVAAFLGARQCAFAAKLQVVPAAIALDVAALAIFAVLAVLWGRLYCEIVCPLGIVQDMVRWIFRKKVRRVCSRLPESPRQRMVRWIALALFMVVGLAGLSFIWLDPYGIFGRGITLSGGLFFVVIAFSAAGRGRFWCNWICPVGTLLQLVSRFSVFKDRFDKCAHCEECRRCHGK